MADSKITALTSIGASTDPANDPLVLVDVSDTSMAATGTTKKVTLNNLLSSSPTATGNFTITGDLTVDTSTLKVDSANNRVGIGTASPGKRCEINQSSNAITTIGAGEILRLIGDDGNVVSRITEIGFGSGPTGATYAPVVIGAVNTSVSGFGTKDFYVATRAGISDVAPLERYRIASDGVATWSNVGGVAGTAMTLNSTGLGVGVSPSYKGHFYSASGSNELRLETAATGAGSTNRLSFKNASGAADARTGSIEWYDVGTFKGDIRLLKAGGIQIRNSADSPTFNLDDTGNVGVGVTPSAWFSSRRALSIGGGTSVSGYIGSPGSELWTNSYLNAAGNAIYIYSNYEASRFYSAGGAFVWENAPNSGVSGAGTVCTLSPKMTLDASGNLLVGKTAIGTTVGIEARPDGYFIATRSESTDVAAFTNAVYSTGASAYRFYVGMGGTVYATNTTISAISDARFKENVQDIDVGLGAILALKPRKFDWKDGKGKNIKGDRGFIAQEFEQVFPQLVDEWADPSPEGEAPYKSVRQDLIPVLVKAIQELTARVEALEA